tara:strand:+ start:7363 stop:9099 length:1737 start_codon:yes stop_codon:yes gene_type:complete
MEDWSLSFGTKVKVALRDNGVLICLAVLALISRVFLMTISLGEVDSGNFCNALKYGYEISLFRPHAPGYPIFIFMAWPLYLITSDCITSLALVSAILGSLVIIPFYLLLKDIGGKLIGLIGSLALIANPLHWSFSEAMLSDVPSTFFVVLSAYLIYRGRSSDWSFLFGSAFMSIAIGVRPANVCIVLLLIVPLILRWRDENAFPKLLVFKAVGMFAAVSSFWFFPAVLLGSDGLFSYFAALEKQWLNAVAVGDISQLGNPWIIQLVYRIERFALGYLVVYPWTGSDIKSVVSLLLCTPIILGFIGFICAWKRNQSDHIFIIVWLITIIYPICTIHFLPRYGIPYIPVFLIAVLVGYKYLWSLFRMHKGSMELLFLLVLDTVLILYLIKLQEPVGSFEVNPPAEPIYIGLLFLLFLTTTVITRVRFQHWYRLGDNLTIYGGGLSHRLSQFKYFAVVLVVPYVIVGYTNASVAHSMNSPGYQLVLDVTRQYSPEEAVVCWDNQTHSIFESIAPEFPIAGRLKTDKLYDHYHKGFVVILTDRCKWSEYISADLNPAVIGTYVGTSPVWSKAPELKSFASVK